MFTRMNDLLKKYPNFGEGMTVESSDGEDIGKVVLADDDSFTIKKGIFFPKNFTLRYSDISRIRDDIVHVKLSREDLAAWKEAGYGGWEQVDMINQGKLNAVPSPEHAEGLGKDQGAEKIEKTVEGATVPVIEEKLEAQKTLRETGAVKLHKVVHTELRHFTIPVMKEEVRVERVPVGKERELRPGEAAFQESTISVPVREEEVEITKRPVVKEEVQVIKEQRHEQREVAGEVKKEEVEIQKEGAAKKKIA